MKREEIMEPQKILRSAIIRQTGLRFSENQAVNERGNAEPGGYINHRQHHSIVVFTFAHPGFEVKSL
jgi:hypothetical protein